MTETPQQDRIDTAHLRDYSQLRRSLSDRKVAGVAGGLGRHLNIDPTILRVAFVVLALFGGAGFLLYGVLWLFVPDEGKDEAVISTSAATRNVVVIVAAVIALLLLIGDGPGGFGFPWPIVVVGLVLFIFLMNRDRKMTTDQPSQGWVVGARGGKPAAGPDSNDTDNGDTGNSDTMTLPPEAPYPDATPPPPPGYPYSGAVPPTGSPYPVQQPPAPRPDRGPKLFWVTVALLAVALGALGLYDVAAGSVVDAAYPALALTVIGVMLVVGAWFGRAGGLIALGAVAALALAATSVTQPRFAGERRITETPTRATQVEDRYFVPAGAVYLDMSNIHDIARLEGRTIEVEGNAGEIIVTLPEGVDADVTADVAAAGEVTILDQSRGGVGGVSLDRTVDGGPGAPSIDLNLDLVVGHIEVRQ